MSGTIVNLVLDKKWGWMLEWGNETFYNEDMEMLTWDRPQDAVAWVRKNFPNLILRSVDYQIPLKLT